ncbi:hypothetical protein TSUD_241740 [Trifolium subterraneum]|uniref:Uncharacterized protein n=1 Tax=Trifolium subterraneum TaxID=3900 RepID=A0A2Z6NKA7_TRISU|nr:hypothetical protein TSUD_241740 [Trifolium subterraneum]
MVTGQTIGFGRQAAPGRICEFQSRQILGAEGGVLGTGKKMVDEGEKGRSGERGTEEGEKIARTGNWEGEVKRQEVGKKRVDEGEGVGIQVGKVMVFTGAEKRKQGELEKEEGEVSAHPTAHSGDDMAECQVTRPLLIGDTVLEPVIISTEQGAI